MSKSLLMIVAVWCAGICFMALSFASHAEAQGNRPNQTAQLNEQILSTNIGNRDTTALPISLRDSPKMAMSATDRSISSSTPATSGLENSTMALLALGLIALGLTRRKVRQ